jgi:hypothetical protein
MPGPFPLTEIKCAVHVDRRDRDRTRGRDRVLVSMLLALVVIPVLYYAVNRKRHSSSASDLEVAAT